MGARASVAAAAAASATGAGTASATGATAAAASVIVAAMGATAAAAAAGSATAAAGSAAAAAGSATAASLLDEDAAYARMVQASEEGGLLRPRRAAHVRCPVCLDDDVAAARAVRLRGCGHAFCEPCLARHAQLRVRDGGGGGGGGGALVRCPAVGCASELAPTEVRALVGAAGYEALDARALALAVAASATLAPCPTPDCGFVAELPAGGDDGAGGLAVTCPRCGVRRCARCGHDGGHDGRTCAEARAASASARGDDDAHARDEAATAAYLSGADARECGRCHALVAKTDGCDKLKCRCGYCFCYRCGAVDARCDCTPASHGFFDNVTRRPDFSRNRAALFDAALNAQAIKRRRRI